MPKRSLVLVLNCGSSSVKFKLFEFNPGPTVLAKGAAERIGLPGAAIHCICARQKNQRCDLTPNGATAHKNSETVNVPNHAVAIDLVCQKLLSGPCGVIADLSEITGIGHRVVHGGEKFTHPAIIDEAVTKGIEACARLAPLHNPPALLGIAACAGIFKDIPQVAVFDTAFHHTIPEKAYLYGIPREYHTKHGIRKYGFHGVSHEYVAHEAAKYLGRDISKLKLITCHLGNGSSITAVEFGKSVDTSMGLTPLGGVMMGSRPGDLDPYIPIFMIKELGMSIDEVEAVLNKGSGMMGISGHADVRDVETHMAEGNLDSDLAIEMFSYRVARRVGSYVTVMNGVDAIVFTGGIGEKDPLIRSCILEPFTHLGLHVDPKRNRRNERCVSTADSRVAALVIPTDEEMVIAREAHRLIANCSAGKDAGAPSNVSTPERAVSAEWNI